MAGASTQAGKAGLWREDAEDAATGKSLLGSWDSMHKDVETEKDQQHSESHSLCSNVCVLVTPPTVPR